MADDTTELTFGLQTEARTAPGAAGAAELRRMLLGDEDEPSTPRFDRSPTFDHPKHAMGDRAIPKGQASKGSTDKQVWPDGANYDGEYNYDGQKDGIGRFEWASGAVYEGDFVEDRLEGSGYFRWPCGSSYEGTWRDGRMHGFGLFRWADGRSYEGEYKNDFKDGQGIFRWPDGRQYNGQWKDGVQNGTGTFTSAQGRCKFTEWRDGQLIRHRRRSS